MQISRSVTRGELTAVIRYTLTDTIRNYNESGSSFTELQCEYELRKQLSYV